MKRIENRKIYHTSNFHKRYFDFRFDQGLIFVKKSASDDSIHKEIATCSIRSCVINNEGNEALDAKSSSLTRGGSLLAKFRKEDSELCPWNFSFILELNDRNMELFAPTRIDRDKWYQIFRTIAEMNNDIVSTIQVNPFEYHRKKMQDRHASSAEREG